MIRSKPLCAIHNKPIQLVLFPFIPESSLVCIYCALHSEPKYGQYLLLEDSQDLSLKKVFSLLSIYSQNSKIYEIIQYESDNLNSQIRKTVEKLGEYARSTASNFLSQSNEKTIPDEFFTEASKILQLEELKALSKAESLDELKTKLSKITFDTQKAKIALGFYQLNSKYKAEIEMLTKKKLFLQRIHNIFSEELNKLGPFVKDYKNVRFINSCLMLSSLIKVFEANYDNKSMGFNFKIGPEEVNSVEWKMSFAISKGEKATFHFGGNIFEIEKKENFKIGFANWNVWVVRAVLGNKNSILEVDPKSEIKLLSRETINNSANLGGTGFNQSTTGLSRTNTACTFRSEPLKEESKSSTGFKSSSNNQTGAFKASDITQDKAQIRANSQMQSGLNCSNTGIQTNLGSNSTDRIGSNSYFTGVRSSVKTESSLTFADLNDPTVIPSAKRPIHLEHYASDTNKAYGKEIKTKGSEFVFNYSPLKQRMTISIGTIPIFSCDLTEKPEFNQIKSASIYPSLVLSAKGSSATITS